MTVEGFRHTLPIEVRFRDIDVLGHVNNAVYFSYMEAARIDYFVRLEGGDPGQALRDLNLILAEISCTFKQPIRYGQKVMVGTRVVRMGNSSYQLESRIDADGELAATGRAVMVHYDYTAGRPVAIPEAVRQLIRSYEGLAS